MTELKPCPHCGGNVWFNHNADLEPDGIVCMQCKTIVRFMRVSVKKHESFETAMNKMADIWNTRTQGE